MNALFPKLAELLEVDTVNPDDVLRDFEMWDSLTALQVVAFIDSEYGITLTVDDFRTILTAGQLAEFIRSRKAG